LKFDEKDEKIKELLINKSNNGKISCFSARKIAEELNVPSKDVGRIANELRIKITNCELGCF
jgi:LAO/AO transport system kinase